MPAYTIVFGLVLIGVGVGTYIGAGEGASFWAFFLQVVLGLLALGLGVGSIVKKPLRMHLMHGAVLLAAMGVIVPIVKLVAFIIGELDTRQEQMDALRIVLTVLASGGYVYLAVQSFRKARRDRLTGKADTAAAASGTESPADPAADR